jgi:hypothetical protein
MFYNEAEVLFELFEVFAFCDEVDGAEGTKICVFYLADCSNQSYFFCKVPCYLYSRTFAGDLEASEFLYHILTLILYFNRIVLSSLW